MHRNHILLFIKKKFYNILSHALWFFQKKLIKKISKTWFSGRNGGQIRIQHEKLLWKWYISFHEHIGLDQCNRTAKKIGLWRKDQRYFLYCSERHNGEHNSLKRSWNFFKDQKKKNRDECLFHCNRTLIWLYQVGKNRNV